MPRMDFQVTKQIIEYKVSIFRVMTSKRLEVNKLILQSESRLVVN